jgi:hypothetical protein
MRPVSRTKSVLNPHLWRDQGKQADAYRLLPSVYGWFTEGLDTPDLPDAKSLPDELR